MTKKELEKTVRFLCRYNKNEIGSLVTRYRLRFRSFCEICFQYLYDGKLMETRKIVGSSYDIVSNQEDRAVISIYDDFPCRTITHYELDKTTAILTRR